LATGPIAWGQPIPGKDGKRIFATGKTRRGELLRFDLKTGQFQPFLGGISAQMVSFSKDGQFVAYVSFPEGILWRANRDGSNPVQLTEPPIHALLPRWSPDGTQIVFVDFTTMPTPAYIVAAAGGNPQRLLPEDHESHTDPNWSADGKKIVFSTATPFNPNGNVRILDLATHQITAVAGSERIYSPRWSPDGRFIAAMPVGGNGLKIFNLASQHWSELVQKDSVGFPSWSRDSQFIYFLRILPNGNKGAFRIRVSGGPPERIADLNSIHLGGWWGWVGLDPNDNPLVLRDAGSDDIYALTLERK
jgi:dipeptidyl aminopeptidase/acylaminoacyl peptidase